MMEVGKKVVNLIIQKKKKDLTIKFSLLLPATEGGSCVLTNTSLFPLETYVLESLWVIRVGTGNMLSPGGKYTQEIEGGEMVILIYSLFL